jgi:WhiB family redox-sensing transcriptional regulator
MTTTTTDWAAAAACRGAQREAFFPPNAIERKEERLEREAVAKRICAGCSVQIACLELALRNHEIHGIWGGMNEEERRLFSRSIPSSQVAED